METFSFIDLVDPNETGVFLVKARISLLSKEESSRNNGIKNKFRPNHNFGSSSNREFYIGQIELLEGEVINLGETADVNVRFIKGRGLKELLTIGRQWKIQEGSRLIGEATVLEVTNET